MPFESLVKIGVQFPKSQVKLPKGWNTFTQSAYNNQDNFAVLTGKVNNIIVVDLDKKDEGFIAEKWFISTFGQFTDIQTLVTTTINGGYHVYFLYNPEIKNIANKTLHIDILSDNRCCYQGTHYDVVNNSTIRSLTDNELQAIKDLKKTVKEGTIEKISTEYKKANELLHTPDNTEWIVTKHKNGVKAVPQCEVCLLNPDKIHTHKDHSALFINKDKSVIKSCFSCGSENLTKQDSKKVVNVFNIIMNVNEDNTVYQDLVADLLKIGEQNHYKRQEDTGIVYRQVKPYAYERYQEPRKYLNDIFNGDAYFKSKVNNMEDLVKFMKLYDDPEFGFLTVDKDYIGFSNGVYNKITCEFTEFPPSGLVVGKYLDLEFDYTKQTPLLDTVLDYQFDPQTRDFIYMCLGRMFGIRDNLQFMLFLLGEPGTGKSVILDVLNSCFDQVGSINSTFEEKFGLSYLYDKDIILCDDLPKNMSKVLDQSTFQSMVSGGKISIAVKGGDAFTLNWKVPIIFSSNVILDYQDKGQISRRVLTAKFSKNVLRPDVSLTTRILQQELPAFIFKCTSYYKDMLDLKSTNDIWHSCPEYFLIQQQELKMERNPLFKFLKTKSEYKEGEILLLETIRERFGAWLNNTFVKSLDNGTFFQVDQRYLVESKMMCKHCNKVARVGCCVDYKNTERTNKKIVRNMRLL
jgi:phage/plasmid-associated DNA primase